jgi:hypothetical protein
MRGVVKYLLLSKGVTKTQAFERQLSLYGSRSMLTMPKLKRVSRDAGSNCDIARVSIDKLQLCEGARLKYGGWKILIARQIDGIKK